VVDVQRIGWVTPEGEGKLCYFDTRITQQRGAVRDPAWGAAQGFGIAIYRDQNVWLGGGVARYTPDRSNGFRNLGNGWWTGIKGCTGKGIRADSRNANAYFVYSCAGDGASVLQIPASTIKVVKMDQQVEPNGWATIKMPCYGVSVDRDENVWGIDAQASTRALLDRNGAITQPDVLGPAMGNAKCPRGSSCPNVGAVLLAYNEQFSFGFERPPGSYQMLVQGCHDEQGAPRPTAWNALQWDADTPPNTSLAVHVKAGSSMQLSDRSWSTNQFTPDASSPPLCLQEVLTPNVPPTGPHDVEDGWLLVEFVFKTNSQSASPLLKSFQVYWSCPP
jgi:hypothetical protein